MELDVTTDGGIDQSQMQADYMSDYQLVDDNGSPISEENDSGTNLDAVPQQETKQTPIEQPAKQENQPDEYLKGFYAEDGTLDVQKALNLFNNQNNQQQPIQQQPQTPKVEQQQPQAQVQPQKQVDPQEQARENMLAALRLQQQYVQAGYDPQTAMKMAENDINTHLNSLFMQKEINSMKEEFAKREEALRQEIKNERELAIAEPKAQKNLMMACSKYANGMAAETLQKAIFDVNIGGNFLLDIFMISNPDKSNLIGEPLHKAINDWFIKNAAKSEKFVDALATHAIGRIQQKVYPEMAKLIQKNAIERNETQKRNKPGPRSSQNPEAHKPSEQSKSQNDLDVFFHNVPRSLDGRPHI